MCLWYSGLYGCRWVLLWIALSRSQGRTMLSCLMEPPPKQLPLSLWTTSTSVTIWLLSFCPLAADTSWRWESTPQLILVGLQHILLSFRLEYILWWGACQTCVDVSMNSAEAGNVFSWRALNGCFLITGNRILLEFATPKPERENKKQKREKMKAAAKIKAGTILKGSIVEASKQFVVLELPEGRLPTILTCHLIKSAMYLLRIEKDKAVPCLTGPPISELCAVWFL